ncbi:hypothetical protein RO787_26870 [Blautia coccoides]|uniref:hypothetical protein n=1 Tax=Blautia producta TaxID=33035 RepID=UPI0028A3C236|nr:hypothetical protein [Blautia coccoides]MDT4376956.1 hypothetical protein [Blautia coccoides]
MLEYEELEELIDTVTSRITLANRMGELETLLEKWELLDLIRSEPVYETKKDGIILVIGDSEVKENNLDGIIKSLGLDKNRFEFCLGYDKPKTYQYSKLQYNTNYRAVIFGPVPHSSTGKKDSGSVIAEMKSHEGYPRVEVLSSNHALKITKTNFKNKLEELISENYI